MRNRHLLPCCLPRGRLGLFSNRRYPGEIAFPDLTMIGMIESETERDGKAAQERRYYLSSARLGPETLARAVRGHWGIENRLPWVLDVVFRDDLARLRRGHAPASMAVVKRMAMNRPGFAGGSNFCKDGAMGTKKPSKPYPAELRERAVRLVREPEGEHASQAAIRAIAGKVGCHAATLRLSVRQAERDQGQRAGLSTEERERLKALEREARERRRANEIPRQASACCAAAAPCPLDRVHRQFWAEGPNRPPRAPWRPLLRRRIGRRPMGRRLHLCRDLARLGARGLRARRLRPPDRRLAGVAHGARRLGSRRPGAGAARPAPCPGGGLVHHSDRGVQHLSITHTERLAEAGIEPSVGSVGDSDDNALAET